MYRLKLVKVKFNKMSVLSCCLSQQTTTHKHAFDIVYIYKYVLWEMWVCVCVCSRSVGCPVIELLVSVSIRPFAHQSCSTDSTIRIYVIAWSEHSLRRMLIHKNNSFVRKCVAYINAPTENSAHSDNKGYVCVLCLCTWVRVFQTNCGEK